MYMDDSNTSSSSSSILSNLIHTDHEWLYHFLQAVASGHVQEFQFMTQE